MNTAIQIAKHLRDVHFGGNWTSVNLKDTLADVSWEQATTKTGSLNTIASLVFHINYYVSAVLKVLQGGPLDAHDKFSFDLPPFRAKEDWDTLVNKLFKDASHLVTLVEQLPDEKLDITFGQEKYGNYYRNLHGLIEHTHYHLGQIVVIKKLLGSVPANSHP
jgi:uncharacterized damage-inducible protein DinB